VLNTRTEFEGDGEPYFYTEALSPFFFGHNAKYREIALQLKINQKAVKRQLYKAKRKIANFFSNNRELY